MTGRLRLLWRMQPWELLFLIGGSLLLGLAMVAVAWQIGVNGAAIAACYEQPDSSLSTACRSMVEWGNTLESAVGVLGAAATVAPIAVGIFIGAPLVSREIEHRTAPIAWALTLSRRRWLVGRVLPAAAAIAIALLLLGQASEALLASVEDGELGFQQYGMFGPILAARGLAVFGIGILVGLMLGRVLPAILVVTLAAIALIGIASIGRDQLMRAEAVWIEGPDAEGLAMIYDARLRVDATGEIRTYEEVYQAFTPEELASDPDGVPPGMTPMYLSVAPERYPSFITREIGAFTAFGLLTLAIGWWIIPLRRPE